MLWAHAASATPTPGGPPPRVADTGRARPIRSSSITVRRGDTLSGLAPATWQALAVWNHLADPNLLMVGQVLEVPPSGFHVTPRSYGPPAMPPAISAPATDTGGWSGPWACIAEHESGGNPATDTGNGFYGAFQDTLGSWQAAGGPPGLPSSYSYATQLAVNERIQQQQGWAAWPVTSAACGH